MSRGSNKKKRMREEIAVLEVKKRNGMTRLIAAIVAAVVLIVVKQTLVMQGVELASSMPANAVLFISMIVLAGVAGYGSRDYARARGQIRTLEQKLK